MLQSMTGFGRSSDTFFNKKVTVEIRSLNSKSTDIYLKIPGTHKSYEIPIRKMIGEALERGKIECIITEEPITGEVKANLNTDLMLSYYNQLSDLAKKVGESSTDLLTSIIRLPGVLQTQETEVSEEEWSKVNGLIEESLKSLIISRENEGKTLDADFNKALNTIESLLKEVPKYEKARIDIIRDRMRRSLEELSEKVDENRFEQELIYYIEKLDVNEEKTRLQHHLEYFRTTMNANESIGKKLGFIAQEMGREINTLGSKSYYADLQKLVVEMKDNLEKIKEQVANTL